MNEFAWVRVEKDCSGNGARLVIRDLKENRVAYFDALQLETLAWLDREKIELLVDPSEGRWPPDAGPDNV